MFYGVFAFGAMRAAHAVNALNVNAFVRAINFLAALLFSMPRPLAPLEIARSPRHSGARQYMRNLLVFGG